MTASSHKTSKDPVLKTAEWLAHSGIQNLSSDKKRRGGVAAWYEMYKRLYPFLYSEITGYALSAYAFAHRIYPDKLWLDRADLAADWLIRNAFHSSGGVRTRYYLVKGYETPNYSFHAGRIYGFDTAMAGYGLIQLQRLRPRQVVADHIDKCWEFLTNAIKVSHHNYYPYYDVKTRRCGNDWSKWSDQVGSFHAKFALFFIDYHFLTKKKAAKDAAIVLLDQTLKDQQANGRFITSKKDSSTHLHPHSYTLEGLVYGGIYLDRKKYLEAAARGLKWALRAVSDDGSVSAIFENGGFAFHERSDIVAQVLRIGSILYALGYDRTPAREKILKKIYDHLILFQFIEKGAQAGGFLYGADTDGRMRVHLNAWASMFAMQSIWMYEEFVLRKKRANVESFV